MAGSRDAFDLDGSSRGDQNGDAVTAGLARKDCELHCQSSRFWVAPPMLRGTDWDLLAGLEGVLGCDASSMKVFLTTLPSHACLDRNSGDSTRAGASSGASGGAQDARHGCELSQFSTGKVKWRIASNIPSSNGTDAMHMEESKADVISYGQKLPTDRLSKPGYSSIHVPNSGSFRGVQRGDAVRVGLNEPLPTSVDPSSVKLRASASSSQSSTLQDPMSLGTDLDRLVDF